jgi:hypothetical protein
MEGERIVSPTTTRYGLGAEDNNLFSDDDEEFSRKWSFQSSSVDPGSPEQISSVYSSNTLDYSIELNDDALFDELLHKINDEKSNVFLFDNNNSNNNSNSTNIRYSTNNNNSTSRIIHNATSPPPSHRLEYGMNSHVSSSSVPLVTPTAGLTRTTDCRIAQNNNQQQSTIPTKSILTTSSSNHNNNKVEDDDRTFVGVDKDVVGGCGICLGISETVNTTLSNMTDILMDYIGNNNTTIIDSACTEWKKNVPGGGTAGAAMQYTNYESFAQKQARLRTEKHTAWKHCFEDE